MKRRDKPEMDKQKTKSKRVDLNPTMSMSLLNVNVLNTPIRKQILGNLLVLQWLGLLALTVRALVRELRSHKLYGTAKNLKQTAITTKQESRYCQTVKKARPTYAVYKKLTLKLQVKSKIILGIPWWSSGQDSILSGFDPWSGN